METATAEAATIPPSKEVLHNAFVEMGVPMLDLSYFSRGKRATLRTSTLLFT
jgi:hypothetical protein